MRPVGCGILKELGSIVRCLLPRSGQRERISSRAADHRLDEPARLSLSMAASLKSPLPFHLTEYYNCAPITSLPLSRGYVLTYRRGCHEPVPPAVRRLCHS